MRNEILQDVWRHRDEFAREHGYDIDSMVDALQKTEPLGHLIDRRGANPEMNVPGKYPSPKQKG